MPKAFGWNEWCTPGMGVNLWGESSLYMNPVNVKNIDTSTTRRQGPITLFIDFLNIASCPDNSSREAQS